MITAAVILFAAIASARSDGESSGAVTIGQSLFTQFYPQDPPNERINTFFAPNYGRTAAAEDLREMFWNDLQYSNAVFCLGRTGNASFRTTSLAIPSGLQIATVDTPGRFRELLVALDSGNETIFTGNRGVLPGTNLSIFILSPSSLPDSLAVRAIYEVDFVTTTTPSGVYATVRRYVGNTLSGYYDIFYPTRGGQDYSLSPLAVAFERKVRETLDEGVAINRYKVAAERPFYFVWWPDPAIAIYPTLDATLAESDPRSGYPDNGEATSLFFAVPMFPSL